MKRKQDCSSWQKVKLGSVVLATGLASIISGCNVPQQNPNIEALKSMRPGTTAVSEEKKEEEKEAVEVYAETTFATNYVFGSGAIIGKKNPKKHGGVNQTFISLSKGNLSGYLWTSFDFQDSETGNGLHELDVGIDYTVPVTKGISATVGYGSWNYPSKLLGEHGDHILHGKVSHTGFLDIEGGLIHLIDHEDVDAGEFYFGKVSKTFELGNIGKTGFSVTPSLSMGSVDNFYSQYGFATLTPGFDIGIKNDKGEPFCNLFVRFQDGKNGVADFVYGGITFPILIGK